MANKTKRYTSVSKMLQAVSDNKEFNTQFQREIAERSVVKWLHALRTAKSVSQEQVATELNRSQSRVSKIENGTDHELRLGELQAYAKAMGRDIQILFRPQNMTLVDEVKYHAFCIDRALKALVKLAQVDEAIAQGVADFHGETFFNLVKMLQKSSDGIPKDADNTPRVRIEIEEVPDSIEESSQVPSDCGPGETARNREKTSSTEVCEPVGQCG